MAVVDKVRGTRTFVEESWAELQKVTWPDRDQLQNATLVVIAFTIAISLDHLGDGLGDPIHARRRS